MDLKTVFLTEYSNLVRYLILQGATPHEADDAIQAAFEQALPRWPTLTNPRAWLYTVARRKFLSGEVQFRLRETPADDFDSAVAASTDDPLAYTVRVAMVTQAIQILPINQRNIMGLTIAGFSAGEIAEILGSTDAAVRQTLYRARITLNEQMNAWKETS
ncbi:RNA polymerase sigma factor [Actinomadura viridis]|uniref:RNA polymerase sigma factor n=1 Tax=Actinomadura viridis TaxID=58110 RepID=UPI003684B5E8